MRSPSNQKLRRGLLSGFPAVFSRCSCVVRSPPSWWKAGHPRRRPGSVAETELLSHLAVLLRPDERIEELFRDFPAKQSEKWGRNTLSPDLAVYGAFQAKEAALFVEYDGHYRHLMPPGMAADIRKTEALLDFAPAGSYVLRIAHANRGLEASSGMGEVVIQSWRTGSEASLLKALRQILQFFLTQHGSELQPGLMSKLQSFMDKPASTSLVAAAEFAEKVAGQRESDFDPANLQECLQIQLDMAPSHAAELVRKCPTLSRYNIQDTLKPVMQQLEAWGLAKAQAAKVIARFPRVLGCGIDEHLKPTVQWLRHVGLTKAEVAKAVARCPKVLGYSIEMNLKPKVQWFRAFGLTEAEVAKVISRHPQLFGYSMGNNLTPTVQWLQELGLTKAEVGRVIAWFPAALGCSMEENLKPTVHWFRHVGLTKSQIAQVIFRCPSVLGRSIENSLQPRSQWLRDLGLTKAEVCKVIAWCPSVLGCSIEKNLKLKVQWLRDLGLAKAEVAKVIARFPQILELSLNDNLKPKLRLLSELFSSERIRVLLVRYPYIFSRSHERWARRIQVLQRSGELSSFGPAIMLTDVKFAMRFAESVAAKFVGVPPSHHRRRSQT